MDSSSLYSTLGGISSKLSTTEVLIPWSDILLEELRTVNQVNSPPRLSDRHYSRSRGICKTRNRIIWLAILVAIGLTFVVNRLYHGSHLLILSANKKDVLVTLDLSGLHFIDANHPHIFYVGRWTSTLDGARKDGSFPGVYLDFAFNGSTSVLLSLHNSIQQQPTAKRQIESPPRPAFLSPTSISAAAPISILARVDEEEYIVLPNATSIVTVCPQNLDRHARHEIRVVAPMSDADTVQTLQIEGVWIDHGGQLLPPGSDADTSALDGAQVTKHGPLGRPLRKMLEVVTDLPGSIAGREKGRIRGLSRNTLSGVLSWEYLIGDMFGADHATIGIEGMCLIQNCIGGKSSPVGIADVFFQSGPPGSEHYNQPWLFQDYTPDVMVMNIGNSDWESFQNYQTEYNMAMWELEGEFEKTYISMIKAIRTLAYPKYSWATMDSSRYLHYPNSEAGVPIFIMRPLRGQLEQATQSVVQKLRDEGDKAVFWLDTSGWLKTEVNFEGPPEDQDFFLDEESQSKRWRLTKRGNQRVAILLHMHVCRYLARDAEKCGFLPPEVYEGEIRDDEAIRFDEIVGERESGT